MWFIGGPQDGHQLAIATDLPIVMIPNRQAEPPLFSADEGEALQPSCIETVRYERASYMVFGRRMEACVAEGCCPKNALADFLGLEFGAKIAVRLPAWLCVPLPRDRNRNVRRRAAGLLWIAEQEFFLELGRIVANSNNRVASDHHS